MSSQVPRDHEPWRSLAPAACALKTSETWAIDIIAVLIDMMSVEITNIEEGSAVSALPHSQRGLEPEIVPSAPERDRLTFRVPQPVTRKKVAGFRFRPSYVEISSAAYLSIAAM
jgi:hypothetical protein